MFVWKSLSWDEMRNQMDIVVTGMVATFGILGAVLFGLGVQQHFTTRDFVAGAELVAAQVVEFQAQPARPGRRTSNVRPIVQYTRGDGEIVEKETGSFSVFWEYEIGDMLDVYVDPMDAAVMPVINSWWQIYDDEFVLLFAGVTFMLTAWIIFAFSFGLLSWQKRLY